VFKQQLRRYRKQWHQMPFMHFWITLGGQVIADHVILKAELD
jgi:hypothetical protein